MEKRYIIWLLLFSLLFSSCNKDNNAKTVNNKILKKEVVNKHIIFNKKIVIDDNCVWCWKCIRLLPKNIKMNTQTLKAEVFNQNNINLKSINKAIDICPPKSINFI